LEGTSVQEDRKIGRGFGSGKSEDQTELRLRKIEEVGRSFGY